jgi:hypothetical protein
MIEQAVRDATSRSMNIKVGITDVEVTTDPLCMRDARQFLESPAFERWCESIDIEAEPIRERVLKAVAA